MSSLDFFEFGVANNIIQLPDTKIREQQQAAIVEKWDATTAMYTIQEQDDYGTDTYHNIEVWIDRVTEMTTRGSANGDDFRKLMFKDICHVVKKGLYYKFDNNTWLTYFTDKYSSLDVDIGVRRCNNIMKIINPENGSVFSIPCVIDYDMTSPSVQVSSNIITPNNHAVVKVQGNEQTNKLFKTNTRYIFSGRPFKLLSYQNALIDQDLSPLSTLLELDLYLDEIHSNDDLVNQIADNGAYNYSIEIDTGDITLPQNFAGQLNATVLLNGEEVERNIIWKSSNPNIVKIDNDGNYFVLGKDEESCIISATLEGNETISKSIKITVTAKDNNVVKILVNPYFEELRQFNTTKFTVEVLYNGQKYVPDIVEVIADKNYFNVDKDNNYFTIQGLKITPKEQSIQIKVQNVSPEFSAENIFKVKINSMIG